MVNEERARKIAIAVLDQKRTFPNSIVLATNSQSISTNDDGSISIPNNIRFLVVDGQHRLWAQKFSSFTATYACMVHVGLTEVQMANLFLEINDNQKRVPASLRWDLVRLVRNLDDLPAVMAADLVYELNTNESSPLYQRVDLTGEQGAIKLKQASLAPDIRTLVGMKRAGLKGLDFEQYYEILLRYFTAIKAADSDGWREATSPLYSARVVRALLRLLPDLAEDRGVDALKVTSAQYKEYLRRIDLDSLSPDALRATQGVAGIKQIYDTIRAQIFEE